MFIANGSRATMALMATLAILSNPSQAQGPCNGGPLCTTGSAATVVKTGQFVGQPPNDAQVLVDKFDASLGNLVRIEYWGTVQFTAGGARYENTNVLSSCTLNSYSWTVATTMRDPFGAPMFGAGGHLFTCANTPNDDLAPFDQPVLSIPDFQGPSAGSDSCPLAPAENSPTLCKDAAPDLAAFQGVGQVAFPIQTITDQDQDSNCNNLAFQIISAVQYTVTVRYTYCAETPGCREHHRRNCGSLLLFPEYDNGIGETTLYSITNACCEDLTGNVRLEFRYINGENCLETNRTEVLTPCDTLSLLVPAHAPGTINHRGYAYVYAKDSLNRPISFNRLVGQQLRISAFEAIDYSMNAVSFRAIDSTDGALVDLDHDNVLDLDNQEYEAAPDRILIPRFLGQDAGGRRSIYKSELVLIALSGGRSFETIVDFEIYNDNEEIFSGQHQFTCWDKLRLTEIASGGGQFTNAFLHDNTNHAPNEILGANGHESGWIVIDGNVANSSQESIDDPAIYAVLIERTGQYAAADLPWEYCDQENGDLLPLGLFGDPRPGAPAGLPDDDQ